MIKNLLGEGLGWIADFVFIPMYIYVSVDVAHLFTGRFV